MAIKFNKKFKSDFIKSENRKNLREILNKHWKNAALISKDRKNALIYGKRIFIKEINNQMQQAQKAYNSLMSIHKILVDVYKKLITHSEKKEE